MIRIRILVMVAAVLAKLNSAIFALGPQVCVIQYVGTVMWLELRPVMIITQRIVMDALLLVKLKLDGPARKQIHQFVQQFAEMGLCEGQRLVTMEIMSMVMGALSAP